MDLRKYSTVILDCDGVVLDSNRVKTTAFYNAALPYGEQAARMLVDYHRKNGGISRYIKFEYFLKNILRVPIEECSLERLLESYAQEVRQGLLSCKISPGLIPLRKAMTQARWMIVSGGDQNELRDIFCQRNMTRYFDGGIFGSPDTKEAIIARELAESNIKMPALFIGDTRYDYEVASRSGLDFIFMSGWTEFSDWKRYQESKLFVEVPDLNDLLSLSSNV